MPDERAAAPEAAATAWLAGRGDEALKLLADRPARGRNDELNRAVVLLDRGRAREAERLLQDLRSLNPTWVPALRWLARAECELGREEALATTTALLDSAEATGRDQFWAGHVFAERGDSLRARDCYARAVASESDLYLGWMRLGDAEAALGHAGAAATAWTRARELYGGGDELYRLGRSAWDGGRKAEARGLFEEALRSLEGPAYEGRILSLLPDLAPPTRRGLPSLCPVLRPGEKLRYQAKYLWRIGTLELENQEQSWVGDQWTHQIRFDVRAKYLWFRVYNSYVSLLAEEGNSVGQRSAADDSTSERRATTYEMDPAHGICRMRTVAEGLFAYDQLLLPPGVQDGVSLIALARACARTGTSVSVLTAADGTWKGTRVRVVGPEPVEWRNRKVGAVRVDLTSTQRGPGGLSGTTTLWISDDAGAVPYRARMKVKLGHVGMQLE